jgi:hypothetical protein
MVHGGLPDRRTSTGDFATTTSGAGRQTLLGARLIPAGAAATAQLTDANGTVLVDLAAPANGPADECHIPILFTGKVTLGTLTGAGAIVDIFSA